MNNSKLTRALAIGRDNLSAMLTEEVCNVFMSWDGYSSDRSAPFGLKSDIYDCIQKTINEAPDKF